MTIRFAIMKRGRNKTWRDIVSGFKTETAVKNRMGFIQRNNPKAKLSFRRYYGQ